MSYLLVLWIQTHWKNLFLISNYLSSKIPNLSIITADFYRKNNFSKKIKFITPRFRIFKNTKKYIKYLICIILLIRETIKDITYRHLKVQKSLCFGQCLTAVGWVGGTLPELYEDEGMVELTTADVANGGIVAGAALSNRRPIYLIRYQGFSWFNLNGIYVIILLFYSFISPLVTYYCYNNMFTKYSLKS